MADKKEQQKWETEEDIRALLRAQEVYDDSSRRQRALVKIKETRENSQQAETQLESKTSERSKKLLGSE